MHLSRRWSLLGLVAALAPNGLTIAAAIPAALALCTAIACALTDRVTGYIFDRASFPALALTLTASCSSVASAQAHVLGAVVVAALYFVPYAVTRGRGFGLGDVKLGAVIGAGMGLHLGTIAFAASFIIGALAGVVLLARGRARDAAIPFGPFQAAGTFVAVAGTCASWW